LQNLARYVPNAGSQGAIVNNFFGSATNAFLRSNYDAKVTWVPTQASSVFGHYSKSPDTINDPQIFGFNPGGGTYDGGQPGAATGNIQNVGLGVTHAFSPHLSSDANFGYTRQVLGAQSQDVSLGAYGVNTLGIPGTNYNALPFYDGIPGFYFTTYADLGNANSGSPFSFRDNQYTGNANATWVHGVHSVRFGGEYLRASLNHNQGSGTYTTQRGLFVFTGGATELPGDTNSADQAGTNVYSFADFLLGQADSYDKYIQTFNPEPLRYSTLGFYAQDTFQVTPKLTLNYGLRYEYYPLPGGDHFGNVRYDPSVLSTVTDAQYGTHTVGTVLVGGKNGIPQNAKTSNGWGMIVPRFGLTYQLDDKTVVRSGFGMTTDPDTLRNLLQAYPAAVTTSINGPSGYVPATSLNAGLLSPTTQVGIPALTTPNINAGYLPLDTNLTTNTIQQNYRRGYIYSYNLAVQREFPRQVVGTVGYVGTQAVRQQTSIDINPSAPGGGTTTGRLLNQMYGPNTNNTDVTALQPFGGSNYNGLQAQLSRTNQKNLSSGIIFTFSKSMDVSDNSLLSGLTYAYPTYYYLNWALAGYDRTYNFQWWNTYSLPFGQGQRFANSGVVDCLVGGWKLSTILSRVSGTPLTIGGNNSFLNAAGSSQVADVVPGVNPRLNAYVSGGRQYINPAAYLDPSKVTTIPQFGDAGRNSIRGPGVFDLDASLKRTFPIHDTIAIDFVVDSFDVTNTPQFANPAVNASAGGFGVITSSNANRTLRLSGRITF
jgi:hypothetical protein